jgi:hypothetical protein
MYPHFLKSKTLATTFPSPFRSNSKKAETRQPVLQPRERPRSANLFALIPKWAVSRAARANHEWSTRRPREARWRVPWGQALGVNPRPLPVPLRGWVAAWP